MRIASWFLGKSNTGGLTMRRPKLNRRLVLSLTAAVVTPLLLPAVAEGTIHPQRSIAGVKLGMKEKQVKKKAGRPFAASRNAPIRICSTCACA